MSQPQPPGFGPGTAPDPRYSTTGAVYCASCGNGLAGAGAFCSVCGAPQSHRPAHYPARPVVDRKDPGVAIILSFLWTGLGQLYVGEEATNRGIVLAVVSLFFLLAYATIIGLVFIVIGLPLWIWGMVDANNAAKEYNARHGLP